MEQGVLACLPKFGDLSIVRKSSNFNNARACVAGRRGASLPLEKTDSETCVGRKTRRFVLRNCKNA